MTRPSMIERCVNLVEHLGTGHRLENEMTRRGHPQLPERRDEPSWSEIMAENVLRKK